TRAERRQAYVEAERAGVAVLGALLGPPEPRGGRQARPASSRQARPPRGAETRAPEPRTPEPRTAEPRAAAEPSLGWADEQPEDGRRPEPAAGHAYGSNRRREEAARARPDP